MYCSNCRRFVPDAVPVCGHCGYRIKNNRNQIIDKLEKKEYIRKNRGGGFYGSLISSLSLYFVGGILLLIYFAMYYNTESADSHILFIFLGLALGIIGSVLLAVAKRCDEKLEDDYEYYSAMKRKSQKNHTDNHKERIEEYSNRSYINSQINIPNKPVNNKINKQANNAKRNHISSTVNNQHKNNQNNFASQIDASGIPYPSNSNQIFSNSSYVSGNKSNRSVNSDLIITKSYNSKENNYAGSNRQHLSPTYSNRANNPPVNSRGRTAPNKNNSKNDTILIDNQYNKHQTKSRVNNQSNGPSSRQSPTMFNKSDWKCRKCGRMNPYNINYCSCGQPK